MPESVTVSVLDTAPKAFGVNVIEIVQFLPAASDEPQVVLLTAKGLPVPVVMPVMDMATVVVLVIVELFELLVLLTATFPKDRFVGEMETWPRAILAHINTATSAQSLTVTGANREVRMLGLSNNSIDLCASIFILLIREKDVLFLPRPRTHSRCNGAPGKTLEAAPICAALIAHLTSAPSDMFLVNALGEIPLEIQSAKGSQNTSLERNFFVRAKKNNGLELLERTGGFHFDRFALSILESTDC